MNRVLVTRLDNEGDVLLAGPAIRAVAAGSEHVTLLCGPRGRQAAALLPGVDEVLTWRAPWIDPRPEPVDRADVDALVADLARRGFDRALILGSWHQSPLPTALLLRLAGVPWVGAVSVDYPGSLLDLRHRVEDDIHEVERNLSLTDAAGYTGDGEGLAMTVEAPPRGRHVVVHPGASAGDRAPDPALLASVVEHLEGEVLVTGGPSETELTARVAGTTATDLGGRTSFTELAALIGSAAAVVVGNTGPAHVAAAMGTPVVSLYGGKVPSVRWRPYGVPCELIDLPDVTVDRVLGAVGRLTAREAVPA